MKRIIHPIQTKQKGFTLLFAILVSTLVVSIGATIISIATRQTILSGTSRESQYAFYAANTALECAHFWDTKGSWALNTDRVIFPAIDTDEAGITEGDADILGNVTCSGVNLIDGPVDEDKGWFSQSDGETTNTTTFYLEIKDRANLGNIGGPPTGSYSYCAEATVTKITDVASNKVVTVIEAKGYNTCDPNHPRRVERGLIQKYES